jgi:hypothetical protein
MLATTNLQSSHCRSSPLGSEGGVVCAGMRSNRKLQAGASLTKLIA